MGKRPYTEAQKIAAKKWDAENYKCFSVQADKHLIDRFTALTTELGRSRNDCIKEAIQMFIDKYTDDLLKRE